MASSHGQKEIKTNWPVVEGTTFRTTKQTGDKYLHAEEGTNVREIEKVGLGDGN